MGIFGFVRPVCAYDEYVSRVCSESSMSDGAKARSVCVGGEDSGAPFGGDEDALAADLRVMTRFGGFAASVMFAFGRGDTVAYRKATCA